MRLGGWGSCTCSGLDLVLVFLFLPGGKGIMLLMDYRLGLTGGNPWAVAVLTLVSSGVAVFKSQVSFWHAANLSHNQIPGRWRLVGDTPNHKQQRISAFLILHMVFGRTVLLPSFDCDSLVDVLCPDQKCSGMDQQVRHFPFDCQWLAITVSLKDAWRGAARCGGSPSSFG